MQHELKDKLLKIRYIYKKSGFCTIIYYLFIEIPICFIFRNVHFWFFRQKGNPINVLNYKLNIPKDDVTGAIKDLSHFGKREFKSTDYYIEYLKSHENLYVFDIGANIGYYAIMAASFGHKVLAIEPESKNYKYLKENIELNKYDSLSNKSNLHSLSRIQGDEIETVKSITLDNVVVKYSMIPDCVRMDVEGHEYNILLGSENTLRNMKTGSMMFVEIHASSLSANQSKKIIGILEKYGFRLIKSIAEGTEHPNYNYMTYRNKFSKIKGLNPSCYECFFVKRVLRRD
jgi:hypothetical protein